jgi:hypothetical protein
MQSTGTSNSSSTSNNITPATAPSPCRLTVAEVRQALFHLRQQWYDALSPDSPFIVSSPAIPATQATSPMSIAEFACLFDYGQHLKRHQRLTPRNLPTNKL